MTDERLRRLRRAARHDPRARHELEQEKRRRGLPSRAGAAKLWAAAQRLSRREAHFGAMWRIRDLRTLEAWLRHNIAWANRGGNQYGWDEDVGPPLTVELVKESLRRALASDGRPEGNIGHLYSRGPNESFGAPPIMGRTPGNHSHRPAVITAIDYETVPGQERVSFWIGVDDLPDFPISVLDGDQTEDSWEWMPLRYARVPLSVAMEWLNRGIRRAE